jgi:hypothetical protein
LLKVQIFGESERKLSPDVNRCDCFIFQEMICLFASALASPIVPLGTSSTVGRVIRCTFRNNYCGQKAGISIVNGKFEMESTFFHDNEAAPGIISVSGATVALRTSVFLG